MSDCILNNYIRKVFLLILELKDVLKDVLKDLGIMLKFFERVYLKDLYVK